MVNYGTTLTSTSNHFGGPSCADARRARFGNGVNVMAGSSPALPPAARGRCGPPARWLRSQRGSSGEPEEAAAAYTDSFNCRDSSSTPS